MRSLDRKLVGFFTLTAVVVAISVLGVVVISSRTPAVVSPGPGDARTLGEEPARRSPQPAPPPQAADLGAKS